MPIETLVKYNKLQIMFDFINEKLPKSFDNKWITVQQRTNRITRSSSEFHIPNFRTKLVSSFPKWSIPKYGTLLKQLILKLKLQEANSTKSLKSIY